VIAVVYAARYFNHPFWGAVEIWFLPHLVVEVMGEVV
jgi:hypothetical protein